MKKTASAIGFAILGLGSSLLASSAQAADLADCGAAPAGGTLTLSGDVCLLSFSAPGTYSFTTPNSFQGLSVLLAGAGGGADVTAFGGGSQNNGYAGSGGKVTYVDLSSTPGNEALSITVGAGGNSAATPRVDPIDGQPTTLSIGGNTSTAAGGSKGTGNTGCDLTDAWDYKAIGDGAGGNAIAGGPCVGGPGVNPSTGSVDSSGAAASPLFQGLNLQLGAGGQIIAQPAALPSRNAGAGANVALNVTRDLSVFPIADAAGANGFAAITWKLPAPVEPSEPVALADTGSDAYAPLLVGAGAMALGAVMFNRAGRRRVR